MKSPPTRRPSDAEEAARVAALQSDSPAGPSRQFGADVLKAAAIVGVVFIHADGVFGGASVFHDVVGDMFRFGVPVFIALYVHFACRSMARRDSPGVYLAERFRRLLLQYVVWSAVYAGVTADWASLTPTKFVTRHWGGNGWAGQYYFIVVLQLTVLMPWIAASGRWFENRRAALIGVGLLFYAALSQVDPTSHPLLGKLSDRPFVYWLPYAWLGAAWMGGASGRQRPAWRAALLASVALIPFEHLVLASRNVVDSIYLMPGTFIAAAAMLHWASGPQEIGAVPAWWHRAVTVLSANTLGIFVFNPLVILLEHRLLTVTPFLSRTSSWPLQDTVMPLVALVAALLPSLGVTLLLKRSAVGRRLVA